MAKFAEHKARDVAAGVEGRFKEPSRDGINGPDFRGEAGANANAGGVPSAAGGSIAGQQAQIRDKVDLQRAEANYQISTGSSSIGRVKLRAKRELGDLDALHGTGQNVDDVYKFTDKKIK